MAEFPLLLIKSLDSKETYGFVNHYESLIWTRTCTCTGDFELVAPYSLNNYNLLKVDRIVVRNSERRQFSDGFDYDRFPMIITRVYISESNNEKKIIVSGRQYLYMFHRRVLKSTINFYQTPELNILKMIRETSVANYTTADRVIFDEIRYYGHPDIWISSERFQSTGDYVDELISNYVEKSNGKFFIYPGTNRNNGNRVIVAELTKGNDRSVLQTEFPRIIISSENGDISQSAYERDISEYANYFVVAGEGEGSARTVYESYANGESIQTGANLREIFVDARDLEKDSLTTSQYKDVLLSKGNINIAESHRDKQSIFPDVNSNKYKYDVDYFLGDIITIKTDLFYQNAIVEAITQSFSVDGLVEIPKLKMIGNTFYVGGTEIDKFVLDKDNLA